MPHSSGGGSHGGGSHGGSHSSSGGGSASRSTTYFKGSHHYAYYKDGKIHHFYNKEPITPEYLKKQDRNYRIAKTIWFCFYGLFLTMFILGTVFSKANRPETTYHDKDIIINDDLDLISEKEEKELYKTLEEFQDKSNVTPYILVISNDVWEDNYTSLQNYAYDTYLELFDDEMHWLIVYSTDEDDEWEDWYWEGMQGDYTDPVLTTHNTDAFTKLLHKEISKPKISLGEALNDSFEMLNDTMYDTHFELFNLIIGMFGICLHAGMFYIPVWALGKNRVTDKLAFELPDPEKHFLEDKCEYCGGMFIHGIHITCPHCGGALPPAEGLVYVPDKNMLK